MSSGISRIAESSERVLHRVLRVRILVEEQEMNGIEDTDSEFR